MGGAGHDAGGADVSQEGGGGAAAPQGGSGGGMSDGSTVWPWDSEASSDDGADSTDEAMAEASDDADSGQCGDPPQDYIPVCPDHLCFPCDQQKLDNCMAVCSAHGCYICQSGKWQLTAVDCVIGCD
jgi:hypothetical protein